MNLEHGLVWLMLLFAVLSFVVCVWLSRIERRANTILRSLWHLSNSLHHFLLGRLKDADDAALECKVEASDRPLSKDDLK